MNGRCESPVPGLLPTEDYARAVISAGKPRDGSAAIDRAVVARLERQAILARWQRLRAWCWPRSGYGTADPPRSDGRPRTGKR